MRWILLLAAMAEIQGTTSTVSDLGMIEELNDCVQQRFQTLPASTASNPFALGMSRIVRPPSFGEHFAPRFISQRDFEPETEREKEVLAALEKDSVQVGFYLFGRAIVHTPPEARNPRTLKGPGAMTIGTPRPTWYPALAVVAAAPADALPDWKTIYPLAQRAMKSFEDRGTGFETSIGSWRIAARPVAARQEKCVGCHNNPAFGNGTPAVLNQPLGGVLYAFRSPSHLSASR
jgi:hypothetical protein